jgi:DNA-binding response OmpR family regulator
MQVLVVEDDQTMASLLERALKEEGDAVVVERNGLAALETAKLHSFDVIVLDVMLPGLDGFEVVHRLRQQSCQTPVLMLTAKDTKSDLIRGLNVGADDYLTKPFDLDVFFARLRAVARRAGSPIGLLLSTADLTLNTSTREVTRGTRALELTRTEYGLLELLIRNTGRIVERERIIDTVWGFGSDVENSTLDTFVHLLRRKVDLPGEAKLIQTVRGVGYTLRQGVS